MYVLGHFASAAYIILVQESDEDDIPLAKRVVSAKPEKEKKVPPKPAAKPVSKPTTEKSSTEKKGEKKEVKVEKKDAKPKKPTVDV